MSKIVGPFLEFPGIVITLLVVLYIFKRKKWLAVLAAILYAISIELVWIPVQKLWTLKMEPVPGDIIVLGGGVIQAGDRTLPSLSTLQRLERGFEIWKEQGGKIFVCGGKTPAGNIEAKLMKEILVSWGVPESDVIAEEHSKTTYENLKNIKDLLSGSVNIVTSSYHTRRAFMVTRKLKINARMIPADYIIEEKVSYRSFLPQITSFMFMGYFSHEIVGCFYYWITGKGG